MSHFTAKITPNSIPGVCSFVCLFVCLSFDCLCLRWSLTHTAATAASCITDRTGVQPTPQPKPHSRTLACSHTAIHSNCLPFNGLHPVVHVITWITTHYRPNKDRRLSWPSWLTHTRRFTHKAVTSLSCQP